jgi:NADPH:quinone reductase-like Zn-dependent oxidoreductase
VTGVCSTANVDMVRSLGVDAVLDYTQEDFTEMGQIYDVIFDTVGTSAPKLSQPALADGGAFVTTQSRRKESTEELLALRELLEEGAIHAVVDRNYTLEQIREAHDYVEQGHKRGNIVIAMPAPAP